MALNFVDGSMTDPVFNDQQLPIGTVQILTSSAVPKGWLLCDGTNVSQLTYSELYAVITTAFGNPGGGVFTLPSIASIGSTGRLRYMIKAKRYDTT
tara:strand:- start:3098 stop:3385 length:288 start_codon:yes stop_codon:yes gene_type:complete